MQNSGIIKKILRDHFDGFWYIHEHRFPKEYREDIKETVLKTLKCGSKELGYAKYECLGCVGEPKPLFVPFTCKSRFCNKCGKKYTDEWAEKQQQMIFNIPHRHMVFTIPQELRKVFFHDRSKLNELSREVAQVFQFHYNRRNKGRGLRAGVITVIHTFGRDLKFNPHIHALVTEGALDNRNEWCPSEYISYEFLRKSWQKLVLDLMKKWFPDSPQAMELINDLYRRYPKGFYVNAEKKMKDAKGAARYIGRYLARPAIAEYRITGYDGREVEYWYEDHKTGERKDVRQSVYYFLFLILQHIPPKHFQSIGRFGLYSRRSYQNASVALSLHAFMRTKQLVLLLEQKKRRKTYRQRVMESYGKDPFLCPHCKREMDLTEVWHSDYGFLYHYMEEVVMIKSWERGSNAERKRAG